MKSLKEYAEKIRDYEGNPPQIANILMEMSCDYAEANNNRIMLEIKKADFWIKNKNSEGKKPMSDTSLNLLFLKDGDGKELRTVELYTKGLEKMMSNARSYLRIQEVILRNDM